MSYLIKHSYFIGICAFVLTLGTYLLFETTLPIQHIYYSLFVLFGTQVLYSSLRLGETIQQPHILQPFLLREIIPIGLAVFFLVLSQPTNQQIISLVASGILSLLYGAYIWQPIKPFSLRNYAWLKLIAIAVVWCLVTTIIPLLDIQPIFSLKHWLYASAICMFIFYLTLPFEISDYIQQEQLDIKTIPQQLGIPLTKKTGRTLAITTWLIIGFVNIPAFFAMSLAVVLYLKYLNQEIEQLSIKQLTLQFDGIIILFMMTTILLSFILH